MSIKAGRFIRRELSFGADLALDLVFGRVGIDFTGLTLGEQTDETWM